MNKILEALKGLLPGDHLNEVASAVEEIFKEAKAELDAEYDVKLQEAYSDLSAELASAEKVAEEGYEDAWSLIAELQNRLGRQNEEFEQTMEEEFEEAYKKILEERSKVSSMEVDIHEEYLQKLDEMKEYMVDKLDQFLHSKGNEIYEQAKRDVLSSPRLAEQKVTLDKITDIIASSSSDDAIINNSKLQEANKSVEDLKAQVKLLDSRNFRLSNQAEKLTEELKVTKAKNEKILTEGKVNDKKERVEKSQKVSGRGRVSEGETVVIAETSDQTPKSTPKDTRDVLARLGIDRETANLLAGTGNK